MDEIKVSKVERVQCRRTGQTTTGTLHLTAHHLIYEYDDKSEEELWIPYPMISLVTRTPMTLDGYYPLSIHLRNFRSLTLSFERDVQCLDVFESARGLTVACKSKSSLPRMASVHRLLASVSQLYAFFYAPNPPFERNDGWSIYSPREEFARMGVGSRTKAWRFTDVNKDYSFCPTYPARMVVPTRISDTTLQYAAKYRSKCRIPTLAYLHWSNFATITRSSQPMVGITNNRSVQDEKLIEAVFQSHYSPESRVPSGAVYGATSTNLIIDARPTTNAMANVAKGAGTENMDYYKDGKKAYLGIDNIHVMRDSLNKVVEVLREADAKTQGTEGLNNIRDPSSSTGLDREALRRSGWLRHLSAILDGTLLIVRNIHINSSHVLVHCSDGWDRTAQLSSLAQLCLDPFYRTYRGFQILVEKDWLSFGHRFLDRCGHLSSEKFFLSAADIASGGGAEAAQALFASVQNRLVGQGHLKETSPVFHQFLECIRQIQRQYPERFEFNARYLERIHYHLYSCQFGTFLFNCERERRVGENGPPPCERTVSIWDLLNSPSEVKENTNPTYDPTLDDPSRRDAQGNMGVLFPDPKDVRFWSELYGWSDEDMNGKTINVEAQGADFIGPIEGAEDDPVSISAAPRPSGKSPVLGAALDPSLPPSRSLSPIPASSLSVLLPGEMGANKVAHASSSAQSLSSSMPNLTSERPETLRQDTFRPFASSTSSFSLRPTSPSRSRSPGDNAARSRVGAQQGDFLPAGVKSMWGKLSFNASAAFSAVQGAYDGVTKELKGIAVSQGWEGQRTSGGELEDRNRPPVLGDDEAGWSRPNPNPFSRSSTLTPSWAGDTGVASERWRNEGSKPSLSALPVDNPWRTQAQREDTAKPRADDLFSNSVWAEDRASAEVSGVTDQPAVVDSVAPSSNSTSTSSPSKSAGDPLGVLVD